jgi:hypothetical protein
VRVKVKRAKKGAASGTFTLTKKGRGAACAAKRDIFLGAADACLVLETSRILVSMKNYFTCQLQVSTMYKRRIK